VPQVAAVFVWLESQRATLMALCVLMQHVSRIHELKVTEKPEKNNGYRSRGEKQE
jgi:hypothetical protein